MSYNDKSEALYVKGCVIACGIEDSQGDILDSESIKKIFTSYNNESKFEVMHMGERISGVTLLENYINKAPEQVGDKEAPIGSWLTTMRVDNPEIRESILNHEFEGVSLSSEVKKSCNLKLPPITSYSSLKDMECLNPVYISLVGKLDSDEGPANGFPIVVQDYTTYIKKSKNYGGKTLKFEEFLKSLKQLLSQVEESEEAPEETPEEKPEEEEKPKIKKDSDGESEAPEGGEEDKSDEEKPDDVDARLDALAKKVEALEKIVAELKSEKEEEQEESEEEEAKPKIQKSRKQMNTEEPEPVPQKTFFEMTGRDAFGRKIRK